MEDRRVNDVVVRGGGVKTFLTFQNLLIKAKITQTDTYIIKYTVFDKIIQSKEM